LSTAHYLNFSLIHLLTIKGAIPVLMRPAAQFTLRSVFGENVIFSLTQRHYRADGELSTTLDPRQCARPALISIIRPVSSYW
ncbi:hypothetical protein PZW08_22495, partial [Klebsiella pneumoniae]